MTSAREKKLNVAFVKLADTLVSDFDVVELLNWLVEQCTDMLDAQAGGLMLVNAKGELQLVASTSVAVELVEVFQLNAGGGPCLDCFRSGNPLTIADIADESGKWPNFTERALKLGFRSVHSTPLRLRGEILGCMNLFGVKPGALGADDIAVAQALADVATIGILQERTIRTAQELSEHLQRALESRVLIEQAKGVLAATLGVTMDAAFARMRTYARDRNLTLRYVADSLIEGRLDLAAG